MAGQGDGSPAADREEAWTFVGMSESESQQWMNIIKHNCRVKRLQAVQAAQAAQAAQAEQWGEKARQAMAQIQLSALFGLGCAY